VQANGIDPSKVKIENVSSQCASPLAAPDRRNNWLFIYDFVDLMTRVPVGDILVRMADYGVELTATPSL
jgi:hypothetical protein